MTLLDWQFDNATYRGQGSYRFNFAQRRSLVLACDVEIVSVVKQPYESLKSLPPNAHYGFAVLFHGSTPFKRVDLEFPATRIFYARNEIASSWVSTELAILSISQGISLSYDCLSPTSKGCASLGLANPEGYILPGHPETIVKVKVPETSQFNIIAYWIPIPDLGATNIEIDGSDGSDGLDEFPRPKVNDPDSPFQGNPPESPRNPANDPRDYGLGEFAEGFDPTKQARVTVSVTANPGSCRLVSYQETVILGMLPSPPVFASKGDAPVRQPCPGLDIGLGYRITLANGTVLGPYSTGSGVTEVSISSVVYV